MTMSDEYQLIVIIQGFTNIILFSLSLFLLSKKLKWVKRWVAWIPGLRYYYLGASLGMSKEGAFCGFMDVMFFLTIFFRIFSPEGLVVTISSLILLIFYAFLFIYRIRMFLQLLNVFGLKRTWLIFWLLFNNLTMLILGFSSKIQPKGDIHDFDVEFLGGLMPAQLTGDKRLSVEECYEGLSVNIRERTVSDFGKKRYLLKDIALNIPPKSLVLLLGGSGAGKTTLINAVIGYEKADATILLNGADVYKDYNNVKYKIGFVPQQNLIRMKDTVIKTVYDSAKIKLPANVSKDDRNSRINDVMDLLGLSSGQEGLVGKKSGGQLRRICIGMELVTNPELFVLDEPDSGLDGVISREIFNKLRQIADEDRIVLVITHTPDRVIDLFDKVIVLGRDSGNVGRLAFYGSPDEAKEFFGKDSMEDIVMCVTAKDEGGEGRADEMIEKYSVYAASAEGVSENE